MALGAALANIRSHYAFHARVRGALARRLGYLTAYFLLFIVARWGDRHARALRWLKALGLSDMPVDIEDADGLRLKVDAHTAFDPVYSIIGQRDYERVPRFAPRAGEVVVDLGANMGVFAVLAGRSVGPDGRVLAVEPHPANCARLRENAALNGLSWVETVEAAASDRTGPGELFVHERAINHSLTRGSGRSLPVRLTTVDALVAERGLARVDLLKIDIEGVVPAALRGARDTLLRLRPRVVLERDDGPENEGVDALLNEADYERREISVFTYAWPRERRAEFASY